MGAKHCLEGQNAMIRMGGVASLVRIVQQGSPAARGYAAGALSSLAEGGVVNRDTIVNAGGIPSLAALAREGTPKACHLAAVALRQLVTSGSECQTQHFAPPCPGAVLCA